jgi:hypothetical protein
LFGFCRNHCAAARSVRERRLQWRDDMRDDKRKSRRKPIRYVAWVTVASDEPQPCLLSDMSDTGARLDVEQADRVPETFVLLLSANGAARRACRVVWRKPHQIGVRFEMSAAERLDAALVPETAAGPETPAAAPAEAAASR